jgi:hypothetical protein
MPPAFQNPSFQANVIAIDAVIQLLVADILSPADGSDGLM